MRQTTARLLIAIVVGLTLAGCQAGAAVPTRPPMPTIPDLPPLGISNETSVAITLVVNGTLIETVPPHRGDAPVTATLPGLPWTVEVRSPSGRTLASLDVPENAYITNNSGRAVRVELACGRIDLFAGPPLLGPAWNPASTGSCD